ncbi:MAG: phenylacetate--CoA ligase family protein [Acidimicrobiales bacterium]
METIIEDLLRWPPDRVEALQVERLRTTIARCHAFHPYYREVMRQAGLAPDDIGDLRDLERLPVTTKADFVADPEKFRLRLEDGPLEDRILSQMMYTTGSTTGVPAPVYVTASDHFDYMLRARRRRDFIDLRTGDLVASLFPLTPFPMGAYARSAAEVSACGGAVLFTDPGHAGPLTPHRRLDEVVDLVVAHQPTVLWGIASFVLRFLRRVAEGGGRLERLRMVMVTGERSSRQLLADLGEGMGSVGGADQRIVNRYGSTEQGSSMVECTPGSGFHDLAPDSVFMEVVDPDSGRRLPDGEEGILAFTHLNRTGTVLLRFAVGDRAALSHDPCPHCGRIASARLVSGPVRIGDVTKVKGMLVNMSGVCDRVAEIDAVRDFQVVLDRRGDRDVLSVRVVLANGPSEGVGDRIREAVQATAHVSPELEMVTTDELLAGVEGGKFARMVDRRPKD